MSDICDIIGGGTPKTTEGRYWGGSIPWISIKDICSSGRYIIKTEKSITEEGLRNSSTKVLDSDTTIISARGTVGEVAMLSKPMAFNQSCFGLIPHEGIDSTFFYYLVKYSINSIKNNVQGSVFDTITAKSFDQIPIRVPDLKYQETIGNYLSKIDDKIMVNQAINDYLAA